MNNPNEKPKHTPGPWAVSATHDQRTIVDSAHTGAWEKVAVAERTEDAHLIAAAPDCLAALETIIKQFAPNGTEGLTVPQANAIGRVMNAIAKARGES